jgi:hypothetical protein
VSLSRNVTNMGGLTPLQSCEPQHSIRRVTIRGLIDFHELVNGCSVSLRFFNARYILTQRMEQCKEEPHFGAGYGMLHVPLLRKGKTRIIMQPF